MNTTVVILALIAFTLAFLSIGPHAVLKSRGRLRSKAEGFLVGAGAGVIGGLVVYLMVGALAATLVLGTIPMIEYLAEPDRLAGAELYDILQPIVSRAIVGTYASVGGILTAGGVIGGMGSLVFYVLRGSSVGRRSEEAQAPTPKEGKG